MINLPFTHTLVKAGNGYLPWDLLWSFSYYVDDIVKGYCTILYSATLEYSFFSHKSDSRIANVHLSVCLSLTKTISLSELLLLTIKPINHRAY